MPVAVHARSRRRRRRQTLFEVAQYSYWIRVKPVGEFVVTLPSALPRLSNTDFIDIRCLSFVPSHSAEVTVSKHFAQRNGFVWGCTVA